METLYHFWDLTHTDPGIFNVLAIDLAIAVVLLTGLRFISGLIANVSTTEELSQKDNFAFGIELAGAIVALAIMLTGAIEGEEAPNLLYETGLMAAYGVLGLILIKIGRLLQDHLILRKFSIRQAIMNENIAAAIVNVGNVIAIAIMIRAVMIWVDSNTFDGLIAVIAGFVVSQIILTLVSALRMYRYNKNNAGKCLQEALEDGNKALAIRYFGNLVGVALAITAASNFVYYRPDQLLDVIIIWTVLSFIITVLMTLLSILARSIILFKINIIEEVDQQQNVGVACIEAAIFIAMGLLPTALMA